MQPGNREKKEAQNKPVNFEGVKQANQKDGFRKMNRRDRKREEIDKINRIDIQQLEEQYKNLAINQDNDHIDNSERKHHHHQHHHKRHFQEEEESMQKQRGWGRGRGRGHHHHHHHRESHQNPFGQFFNREASPNEESGNEHIEKSNSVSENFKGEWRDKKRRHEGDKRLSRQEWEKQRRQLKDNQQKKPRREEWEGKRQYFARQGQLNREERNLREGKWEKRNHHQIERQERKDVIEKERENRAEKLDQARQQRQEQIQQRRQERQNRKKADRYDKRADKYQNRGDRKRQDPNPNNNINKQITKEPVKIIESVDKDKEIPEYLICPITQQLMNTPMILATCGHTFQEATIRQWLQKEGKCPLCKKPSQTQHLIKNFALAEVCRAHK